MVGRHFARHGADCQIVASLGGESDLDLVRLMTPSSPGLAPRNDCLSLTEEDKDLRRDVSRGGLPFSKDDKGFKTGMP